MTAKLTLTGAVLTCVAGVAAVPSLAQSAAIDINGDGMYSYPELRAVRPGLSEEAFTALDVSGDGLLDGEEIAAATAAGALPG